MNLENRNIPTIVVSYMVGATARVALLAGRPPT